MFISGLSLCGGPFILLINPMVISIMKPHTELIMRIS